MTTTPRKPDNTTTIYTQLLLIIFILNTSIHQIESTNGEGIAGFQVLTSQSFDTRRDQEERA